MIFFFQSALLFFFFVCLFCFLCNLQTNSKTYISRPFPLSHQRAEFDVNEIEVPSSDEKHLTHISLLDYSTTL